MARGLQERSKRKKRPKVQILYPSLSEQRIDVYDNAIASGHGAYLMEQKGLYFIYCERDCIGLSIATL
jgi:hypothetical protein